MQDSRASGQTGAMELLPCPFCGGNKVKTMHMRDGRNCSCPCGASIIAFQPDAENKCREKWNTRALRAVLPALSPPTIGDRNAVIEECAVKMDEMEAKCRVEMEDDRDTYESLHQAMAYRFAARILRAKALHTDEKKGG